MSRANIDSTPATDTLSTAPTAERLSALKHEAVGLKSLPLTPPQICDLALLLAGGFGPLSGYPDRADYAQVLDHQRLANGVLFPVPLFLEAGAGLARQLEPGERVVLRDDEGAMLALLTVAEIWPRDRQAEAEALYPGTPAEASDSRLGAQQYAIGGRVESLGLPPPADYPELRPGPQVLRQACAGSRGYIAVEPLEGMTVEQHRGIAATAEALGASVLLHPVIGDLRATDLRLHRRVKAYRESLACYPAGRARLALLPLARGASGARELLWRAWVHRQHGADSLFTDPEAFGLGGGAVGVARLRALADRHGRELGIGLYPLADLARMRSRHTTVAQHKPTLPDTSPATAAPEPVPSRPGFTCFFTGLSGAGKSTLAKALAARLAAGGREVSVLDGDLVRQHLSSELTFSKEHRDLNIRRIGFVASEVTRHGGIAICAPIAPYAETRAAVRHLIERVGHFIEIHVATPLAVCARRDPKGLYAKAQAGLLKAFTGVDDPYEAPTAPELVLDTAELDVAAAVDRIIAHLVGRTLLPAPVAEAAEGAEGVAPSAVGMRV